MLLADRPAVAFTACNEKARTSMTREFGRRRRQKSSIMRCKLPLPTCAICRLSSAILNCNFKCCPNLTPGIDRNLLTKSAKV